MSRSRDRHGRGLRGLLFPSSYPGAVSRHDRFCRLVEDAAVRLHALVGPALDSVEFRCNLAPTDADFRRDMVQGFGARLAPNPAVSLTTTAQGRQVITVHRKPLEHRCPSPDVLPDLVYLTLLEQWSMMTGESIEEIDPEFFS